MRQVVQPTREEGLLKGVHRHVCFCVCARTGSVLLLINVLIFF